MKSKKIIFVVCLFVALLSFGISKINLKASGAYVDGINYYYAPFWVEFTGDSLEASVDFLSPTISTNGRFDSGIWGNGSIWYDIQTNVLISGNENYYTEFIFNTNDELLVYSNNVYSLDAFNSIILHYDNIYATNSNSDMFPRLGMPYNLIINMTYYDFNSDNRPIERDYSVSLNGYYDWFSYIFTDLNVNTLFINSLEVIITNPNLRDTFELLFVDVGEYPLNGFTPLSDELIERLEYTPYPLLDWLGTSISSFLNTPIFGSDITISVLLLIITAIPLVIALLKFFAGG